MMDSSRTTFFTGMTTVVAGVLLGIVLLLGIRWSERLGATRPVMVLFLAPDEQGVTQIFAADPERPADPARQLTTENSHVLDYAVAPDGESVAFSASDDDGSHDLFSLDVAAERATLLLDCQSVSCTQPVWFPDGQRLVYERRTLASGANPPGLSRLFWFDISRGQTTPVFLDEEQFGLGAAFSVDGRWLAMVVPEQRQIFALDLSTGRSITTASSSGERPVWGANHALYFSEIELQGERVAVHLFKLDVETARAVDLSGANAVVNDGSPAWLSAGDWVAFTRKAARTAAGKQLWVMDGGGSGEPRPLTTDLDVNNGRPAWSPDGQLIAIQQFDITEPFAEPSIWVIANDGERAWQVAKPGWQPVWLPAKR